MSLKVCKSCKGQHVQVAVWMDPNTGEIHGPHENPGAPDSLASGETAWCLDCEAYTTLEEVIL